MYKIINKKKKKKGQPNVDLEWSGGFQTTVTLVIGISLISLHMHAYSAPSVCIVQHVAWSTHHSQFTGNPLGRVGRKRLVKKTNDQQSIIRPESLTYLIIMQNIK
jgi:hypothetical protein